MTPSVQAGEGLIEAFRGQADRLGNCVHCGFCLPACPTYQRLGDEADSPRGRLHLMRAVVEDRLDPASSAFQVHLDRCLGCRACETVCPSGVEYGHLLERARSVARAARPSEPRRLTRLLLATMASPPLTALFTLGGRVFRGTGIPGWLARWLPSGRGLGSLRLPLGMLAASRPVKLAASAPVARSARPVVPRRGRVGLLEGCVQGGLFGHVHDATRLALSVNGWQVEVVGGQGCCGALHAHAGALDKARELAIRNVQAFRASGVDFIAVNAAGCGALLRELPGLLEAADPEIAAAAQWVSDRVRDVSELVAGDVAGARAGARAGAEAGARVGAEPVRGAPLAFRVVYDPPCHLLHGQRVSGPPERMLDAIPGLVRLPLRDAEGCCGGAGIYGITHPELGGRIGSDKVAAIVEAAPDLVVTGNPGCQMQIGSGLRGAGHDIHVLHPVELLAESYRRAGWDERGEK
jgi:glycolate oxidase iron-sulfur subunit